MVSTIDTSGRNGRHGHPGRPGANGKDGRRLKEGGYSKGSNGADGAAGTAGTAGANAKAIRLKLEQDGDDVIAKGTGGTQHLSRSGLILIARGGTGGDGGDGGLGGRGGSGTPSGEDGRAGNGGNGGAGGDGGDITVETSDAHLLALLKTIDAQRGLGGAGGVGEFDGRPGTHGYDGKVCLRVRDRDSDRLEEGTNFAVSISSVELSGEGMRDDDCFPRGTRVELAHLTIDNHSNFTVDLPLTSRVSLPHPFRGEQSVAQVDGDPLRPKSSRSFASELSFVIPYDAPFGTREVRIKAQSTRGKLTFSLSGATEVPIDVNYRLSVDEAREVANELDGTKTWAAVRECVDSSGWNRLEKASRRLSTYQYREQVSAFLAEMVVVFGVEPDAVLLVRAQLLRCEVDAEMLAAQCRRLERVVEREAGGGAISIGLGLFLRRAVPEYGSDVLDVLLRIAIVDGVLSQRAKHYLVLACRTAGLNEEELAEDYPILVTDGATALEGSNWNSQASGLIPWIAGGMLSVFYFAVFAVFGEPMPGVVLSLGGVALWMGAQLTERSAFRMACADCGALELEELGDGTGLYRCRTCGSRMDTGVRDGGVPNHVAAAMIAHERPTVLLGSWFVLLPFRRPPGWNLETASPMDSGAVRLAVISAVLTIVAVGISARAGEWWSVPLGLIAILGASSLTTWEGKPSLRPRWATLFLLMAGFAVAIGMVGYSST